MPKLSFLLLPAVLAVAVYFIVSSFNGDSRAPQTPLSPLAEDLVAIAEGINTVFYNEQGEVSYTLRAERQMQRKDDTSELSRPAVQLYRDNESHWNIVADSGNISARRNTSAEGSRLITLTGNVRIQSTDDFGNPLLLLTDWLSISPANETAETDRQVVLQSTAIEQTSLGMIADLSRDQITFLSDSEGYYVPPAP
ncbi:MAG: LPS export ABC transporter periplasmic protein LptC [Pseudohongiellaceae bacterium]